jgi:hypothetical protein
MCELLILWHFETVSHLFGFLPAIIICAIFHYVVRSFGPCAVYNAKRSFHLSPMIMLSLNRN